MILVVSIHLAAFSIFLFEWLSPSGYDMTVQPPRGTFVSRPGHTKTSADVIASFLCFALIKMVSSEMSACLGPAMDINTSLGLYVDFGVQARCEKSDHGPV